MRILSGKYTVHSPFVFNLITKVIEERNPFYRFEEIELLRKRLLQDNCPVTYPDLRGRKGKQTETTIAEIVRREAVTAKKGALLFRLANYFKPKTILSAGSSVGISTLYLSSCAAGIKCVSIEPLQEFAAISQWVYDEAARTPIELHTGEANGQLTECLNNMEALDFVFFNSRDERIDVPWMFNACLTCSTDHTLFIIDGINENRRTRATWNEITGRPEVTVSINLRTLGLVFLNRKLHKRNYKIHF